jgi:metallo-beta-lactamase family protein
MKIFGFGKETDFEIKLSFLGAVQNVTGSRFMVEVDGFKLLVDCGLYQERQFQDRNWDPFPVPAGSINAVLLTHAHLDHCGLLPKLVKEGFTGKIYCTEATAEIAQIVLLDAGHIQEEDAAYKRKRHKREGRESKRPIVPLYTVEDAEACSPLFYGVKYETRTEIAEGVTATFYDAGHILGASMIRLRVSRNGDSRTILFSGDVGRGDRPILEDPTVFDEASYILVESTYGDRIHQPVADVKDRFAEVINAAVEAGGNIIIPSFSVERSQEVLYYLNELLLADRIPHLKTFLDSPMAIRVTEVFKKHPELFDSEMTRHLHNHESPFSFAGLQMTLSTKESKAINDMKGPVIIIAGSGMCTGGRVKHHLVNNITKPESTILFVGYQAVGTLGRRILDGEKQVRILGREFPVQARVERIHGFSAHADREELVEWLGGIKKPPRQVFVVHGEKDASQNLCEYLIDKTGWQVTVPEYQQQVTLD